MKLRFIIFYGLLLSSFFSMAQNAIPVGFSDVDEQVHNLQLLGKVDANQSMLARPFYSTGKQSMQDLYRLIDPAAHDSIKSYKKGLFKPSYCQHRFLKN